MEVMHSNTASHTKDALCKRQTQPHSHREQHSSWLRRKGFIRGGALSSPQWPSSLVQTQRTPGEGLLLDHITAVCLHTTHFCCSLLVSLIVSVLTFLFEECSLCLSKRLVCVFQYVFLSFVALAWRIWNFLYSASQTNDTVVVVGNKPLG